MLTGEHLACFAARACRRFTVNWMVTTWILQGPPLCTVFTTFADDWDVFV